MTNEARIKVEELEGLVVATVTNPAVTAHDQPNTTPTVACEYKLSESGPIRYFAPSEGDTFISRGPA